MSTVTYELTPQEMLFHRTHERTSGSGSLTAAMRFRGLDDRDRLATALRLLQQRHPALRARIVDAGRWAKFEVPDQPPPIPVTWDTTTDERAWETAAGPWCEAPFDVRQGPLARVRILQNVSQGWSDMLLALHHSVMDGRSMFSLQQDLVKFYDAAAGPLPQVPSLDWPRPELRPYVAPTGDRPRGRLRQAFRQWWQRRGQRRAVLQQEAEQTGANLRWVAPDGLFLQLNQECRKQQASLYGALSAALLQTLAEATEQEDRVFLLRSPVSLRPAYQPPVGPEYIGCYSISTNFRYVAPGRQAFWDVAREASGQVMKYVLSPQPSVLLRLLKAALRLRLPLAASSPTCQLNNLGVIPDSPAGATLQLEEFGWVANARRVRREFLVGAVTVRGRLNLTFRSFWHTPAGLQRLALRFQEKLAAAAEGRLS